MSIKEKHGLKKTRATLLFCSLTLFSVAVYAARYEVTASNGERISFYSPKRLSHDEQVEYVERFLREEETAALAAAQERDRERDQGRDQGRDQEKGVKETVQDTVQATEEKLSIFFGDWFGGPSNRWECILDQMPGIQTDAIATEVIVKCKKDFPDDDFNIEKKSSVYGVKTASECTIKHGRKTLSPAAVKWIRDACRNLYPKK